MAAEPDTTEPGVSATEARSGSIYEATITNERFEQPKVTLNRTGPPHEASDEIQMPVAMRGILRNPLTHAHVTQLQTTPPRTVSTLRSIGRGGLFDGSRIVIDDFSADSFAVSTVDTERTLVASTSLKGAGSIVDQDTDAECERHGTQQRSGATNDVNDENMTSRAKIDSKKNKKCVSFNEVPFVIRYDVEQDDNDDGPDTMLNDVVPFVTLASPPIVAVSKTFGIVEKDDKVPEHPPSNIPTEGVRGGLNSRGALPVFSEVISPRSIENEQSDSSAVLAPGQFSVKQVEDDSCAHRDKTLPTIHVLHDRFDIGLSRSFHQLRQGVH